MLPSGKLLDVDAFRKRREKAAKSAPKYLNCVLCGRIGGTLAKRNDGNYACSPGCLR